MTCVRSLGFMFPLLAIEYTSLDKQDSQIAIRKQGLSCETYLAHTSNFAAQWSKRHPISLTSSHVYRVPKSENSMKVGGARSSLTIRVVCGDSNGKERHQGELYCTE